MRKLQRRRLSNERALRTQEWSCSEEKSLDTLLSRIGFEV
jgi:hypothetical protein